MKPYSTENLFDEYFEQQKRLKILQANDIETITKNKNNLNQQNIKIAHREDLPILYKGRFSGLYSTNRKNLITILNDYIKQIKSTKQKSKFKCQWDNFSNESLSKILEEIYLVLDEQKERENRKKELIEKKKQQILEIERDIQIWNDENFDIKSILPKHDIKYYCEQVKNVLEFDEFEEIKNTIAYNQVIKSYGLKRYWINFLIWILRVVFKEDRKYLMYKK